MFSKTIFKTSSIFSKEIKIIEISSERRLLVNGIAQSVYPLDNNWQRFGKRCWGIMLDLAKQALFEANGKKVLLLGLAGGTMVHLLSNNIGGVEITAVELDKTLIDLGKHYFFLNQFNNLKIFNDDARNLPNSRYDVIINDLFSSEHSPYFVDGEDYLLQLRNRLNFNGLLICNRIFREKEADKRRIFLQKLQNVFDNAGVVEIKSPCSVKNYIFWGKTKSKIS